MWLYLTSISFIFAFTFADRFSVSFTWINSVDQAVVELGDLSIPDSQALELMMCPAQP